MMGMKRFLVFAMMILGILLLSACVLRASTPPPENVQTFPTEMIFPQPVEEENPLALLGLAGTQTALAPAGHSIESTPLFSTTIETTETAAAGETTPAAESVSLDATTTAEPTLMTFQITPPTPGVPATYKLQKGEFPYCIARRFNVSVSALLNLNGLTNTSKPPEGMVLNIPQDGVPFAGQRALHPHPTTYTVKANDTIYTVACYFGDVDPMIIAQANNLQPPYTLTPGQILQIP